MELRCKPEPETPSHSSSDLAPMNEGTLQTNIKVHCYVLNIEEMIDRQADR